MILYPHVTSSGSSAIQAYLLPVCLMTSADCCDPNNTTTNTNKFVECILSYGKTGPIIRIRLLSYQIVIVLIKSTNYCNCRIL